MRSYSKSPFKAFERTSKAFGCAYKSFECTSESLERKLFVAKVILSYIIQYILYKGRAILYFIKKIFFKNCTFFVNFLMEMPECSKKTCIPMFFSNIVMGNYNSESLQFLI